MRLRSLLFRSVIACLIGGCSGLLASPTWSQPAANLHFLGPISTSVSLQVSSSPPPPSPEPPPPITPPPPEVNSCPAGQAWDADQRRCVNPCPNRLMSWHAQHQACVRQTTVEYETETEPCGRANEVITRSRHRAVYQGRLLDGTELLLYDPWSAWSAWGACRPGLPTPRVDEPGDAAPGKSYTITALICTATDEGYDSAIGPNWAKNRVIQYYRNFGSSRRCPEASGFVYWLQDWHERAIAWVGTYGMWHELALERTWDEIKRAIDYSATQTREHDPPQGDGGVAASQQACLAAARARWRGFSGTVQYVMGSGNRCTVKTL